MITVPITQEMRELVRDVKAFRNRYTLDETPTDELQRTSRLAELCVQQWLTDNLGIGAVREAIGDEREYFDICAHTWRIDVKDTSNPSSYNLIYPCKKRDKLENAYRNQKFDGFIATSSSEPEQIAIIGGVSLPRFWLEGFVRGQEENVFIEASAPNLLRGTTYINFDALTDPQNMLRVFAAMAPAKQWVAAA